MFVLQAPLCNGVVQTPKSAPCEVREFDSAVKQLVSQGRIQGSRVGIIGFSYTVYTALAALTTGSVRFAAASVTDGFNYDYWEDVTNVDWAGNIVQRIDNEVVGAKPFGVGLRVWFRRAPDFNMQSVHTPLLVNALNKVTLLVNMWEPYALLRMLKRPVDLVVFRHNYEHDLNEPAARMASQGGSVDWFRFWLQGYESPHPVIEGEYRRWEKLCDMQRTENPGDPAFCIPTKGFRAKHSETVRPASN